MESGQARTWGVTLGQEDGFFTVGPSNGFLVDPVLRVVRPEGVVECMRVQNVLLDMVREYNHCVIRGGQTSPLTTKREYL